MDQTKPTVYLWHSKGLGVILLCPSGVLYSNQTGGYSCFHPAMEGIYIPMQNEAVDQEGALAAFFTGPKWQGWCNDGINEETADFVDAVLGQSPYTRVLKVDRARLADSHEAWIHVTVEKAVEGADNEIISELSATAGVVTWENSD
jgi:hypothetical protein